MHKLNTGLIDLYWEIGGILSRKVEDAGWVLGLENLQAESLRHTDVSNTKSKRDWVVIYAAGLQPAFLGLPYTQGAALG